MWLPSSYSCVCHLVFGGDYTSISCETDVMGGGGCKLELPKKKSIFVGTLSTKPSSISTSILSHSFVGHFSTFLSTQRERCIKNNNSNNNNKSATSRFGLVYACSSWNSAQAHIICVPTEGRGRNSSANRTIADAKSKTDFMAEGRAHWDCFVRRTSTTRRKTAIVYFWINRMLPELATYG